MPSSTLSGTMSAGMGAPRPQGISSLGNLSGQVAMKQQAAAGQQSALDRLKLGKHLPSFNWCRHDVVAQKKR